jgi:hypothetical protein
MGRLDVSIDRLQLAQCLSLSLEHVAASLASAADVETFVAALALNEAVWRDIERFQPLMGWEVPPHTVAFSLAASARRARGIDDHTVESIIAVNRNFAPRIGEVPWKSGRSVRNRGVRPSQLDLGAQFDHAAGRDLEEVGGRDGIAAHHHEQVLAP